MKKRRRQAIQGRGAVPPGISRVPSFTLIALFLALAAYIGLAIFLLPPSTGSPMAELFIPELRGEIRPESQEKFLYIFGLFCIPTLPVFFYWLLMRCNRRFDASFSWLDSPRLVLARDLFVAAGALGWLCYLSAYSEIPQIRLFLGIALAGAFLLAGLMRWKPRLHRYIVYGMAGLLLFMLADLLMLSDDQSLSILNVCYHFNIPLGAVIQAIQGRTIMVDTISQYGILYPYIAALALAPFELTAQHVALFFVAIGLITLIFTYLALARKTGIGSPLTLFLFVGVAGIAHPFFEAQLFGPPAPLVYYQHYPLRVVCGAFFLWFVSVYFARKSRWLALLGYAAAGFSALWNIDTGLVILIAWTGTLLFDAVATHAGSIRKMLAGAVLHVLMCGLTLLLSVGFYSLFAWLRSGQLPKFENYYLYQKTFYAAGFYMLPMNPREFWQPIILVYLVTVFYCIRQLFQQKADASVKWYFFIALYGLGIFSYYQGRSHVYCLPMVIYPAVMLSGFLAVDFLRECQSASWRQLFTCPGYRYTFLKMILCLVLPAFGIINFCRYLPEAVCYAVGEPKPPAMAARLEPLIQMLQKHIGNSRTVIFSPISNYLHLKTKSYSALPFSAPAEVLLLSQVQEVQDVLDREDLKCIVIHPISGLEQLKYLRFEDFRIVERMGNYIVLEKIRGQQIP